MERTETLGSIATVPLPVPTGLCVECGHLTTETCPSCADAMCGWCRCDYDSTCWTCADFRNPRWFVVNGELQRITYGLIEGVPA